MAQHEHDLTDITGNQEDTNQLPTPAPQPEPVTGSSGESQSPSGPPAAPSNDTSASAPRGRLCIVRLVDASTGQPLPKSTLPPAALPPAAFPAAPLEPKTPAHCDSTIEPLTYSRDELAVALGLGVATVDRMDRAKKLPRPIWLGGRKIWLRETITEWLRLGASPREQFEARDRREGRP